MNTMKFCKDCKHYYSVYKGVFHPEVPGCGVEQLVDLVDGEKCYHRCSVMRAQGGRCGIDGILFEPASPPKP